VKSEKGLMERFNQAAVTKKIEIYCKTFRPFLSISFSYIRQVTPQLLAHDRDKCMIEVNIVAYALAQTRFTRSRTCNDAMMHKHGLLVVEHAMMQ
jgi:hypothetical protein